VHTVIDRFILWQSQDFVLELDGQANTSVVNGDEVGIFVKHSPVRATIVLSGVVKLLREWPPVIPVKLEV
jgi:hypothetical protein